MNGYFATDSSQLLLSFNGHSFKKNEIERYMKHIVTDLNDINEPIMFSKFVLGDYSFDSFFENFTIETSLYFNTTTRSELFDYTQFAGPNFSNLVIDRSSLNVNKNLWLLHFDGSKTNEGAGIGCILKDPSGNKFSIACRLEFECTNSVLEYEDLIQGLKKAIDLKEKYMKVTGDTKIIAKQI